MNHDIAEYRLHGRPTDKPTNRPTNAVKQMKWALPDGEMAQPDYELHWRLR